MVKTVMIKKKKSELDKKISNISRAQANKVYRKNAEAKYHDTDYNSTIDASGTVQHLSNMAQDDTSSGRDGETVQTKSIFFRYSVVGADSTNLMRVIVFADRDSSGTAPTVLNVLSNGFDPRSALVNTNKLRFKVLYDRLHALEAPGTGNGIQVVKKFIQYNRKMTFSTTSGSPRANALFVLLLSDSGAVSHPTFHGHFRLRYMDG